MEFVIYIVAQVIGIAAVVTFTLSYQMKRRRNIVLLNTVSRCLYIVQYLMLGAYSGAVLDVLGAASTFAAGKKDTPFIKKHIKAVLTVINGAIVIAGLAVAIINRSFVDILPLIGVLLHTSACWISSERIIRRVSLLGSPFWFSYNILSRAYGSSVGDILTMLSIIIAMIKYRNIDEKAGK